VKIWRYERGVGREASDGLLSDHNQRRAEDQRHGPEWPERLGYLVARWPAVGAADFCLEWRARSSKCCDLLAHNGIAVEAGPGTQSCARGPSTSVYFRNPDGNLVEFTVYRQAT
jgi:hypothetical protein